MPKVVIIQADVNLHDAYQAILRHVDQVHHDYRLHCPHTYPTEEELAEQQTMSAHAQHAGDLYDSKGVHLERRLA